MLIFSPIYLKKLRYKKITALIDDQLVIRYHYTHNKKPFPFRVASNLENYPLYIAFSPQNYKSKQRAEILSEGSKKLEGSVELANILKKYGLIEEDILKSQ